MTAPQVSTGISFLFPDSGFQAEFIDVTPPQFSREALETSHMLTTDFKTYIQAKLIEGGSLDCTIHFDPGVHPPISEDPETISVTFADASTWAFEGFMTENTPAAALETVMTANVSFKVADDVLIGGSTVN